MPSSPRAASAVAPRPVGRPRDEALNERRRAEILDAATRVFAERGFPGTDLELVAREAGVAKGSVYRHFESKRALFLAAVDRGMWGLREALDACADPAADAIDQLEAAVRAYLGYFDAHPDLVELLMLERAEFRDRRQPTYFVHRDAAVRPWRALLEGLIADGRMRPVPAAAVADLVTNLLYGTLFLNHFRAPARSSVDDQVALIRDVLLFGLVARSES